MILKKQNSRGFSLVEMIIYITILSVILIVVVSTVVSFTQSYRQLGALRIMEHSALDGMERMTRDVRAATSIDTADSTFGANPGVLTLIATSNGVSTTTKYYLQNGVLKVDINGLYFGPLSVSGATVTNLVFNQLTNSVSNAVKIDMTVQGTVGVITKTGSYHSTIILKGQ